MRLAGAFAGLALAASAAASTAPAAGFSQWAAVIVSGDNRAAHADEPTEAFDNARRDIALALEARGFAAANVLQFAVEPNRHPDTLPGPARAVDIATGLSHLAVSTSGGCLLYLTSHGSPEGAVLGDRLLPPKELARLIRRACGARPTIVVISACFSGIFIPALAGPKRMVLTAARRDRSSFGCGESDKYPFFDACILEALPGSTDFADLAGRARRCVTRREKVEQMSPSSKPQVFIGRRFYGPAFSRAPA